MRPPPARKLIAHRLLPASIAAGVILLLCAATANAGRGAPPVTVLKAGGQAQRGGLVWEDWTARSGKGCVQSSGDGDGAYPKQLLLTPGHRRARFVLKRRQRPSGVEITAWHTLDSQGQQTGPSETLPRTLTSRRDADGRVTAWVARFAVDVPPSYFIRLYVRWPDGKCGGPRHVLRTYSLGASGLRPFGYPGGGQRPGSPTRPGLWRKVSILSHSSSCGSSRFWTPNWSTCQKVLRLLWST